MSGPEAGHPTRAGGMIFAGAALLALGALGLQWRKAPAVLRNPLLELVFVGAGIIVLCVSLVTLALERRKPVTSPPAPSRPGGSSSESSLMTLPAIVGEDSALPAPSPSSEPAAVTPLPPTPVTRAPAGLAAASPDGSTLLIPFAEESVAIAPSLVPAPGQTVSRLVDRMDALQRVEPASPSPGSRPAPPTEHPPLASQLLLRLTRIPTPPSIPSTASVARRCNDCGDPLGSPPQFEPCADCGRALCERCYWRTSSGPQAHLCTLCFQDRSVPRPLAPAVTSARPGPISLVSTPSGRTLQPRRPVS